MGTLTTNMFKKEKNLLSLLIL